VDSRFWGTLVIVAAVLAGSLAYALGLDPCLTSALVGIVGVITLSAVVVTRARRDLTVSRARLMRYAQMCPACGYTIRVDTDRCPECGTPIEQPAP
jgi:hypothetical protein